MMDQYAICYILLDLVVVDLLLCIILYVGLGDNFMTDTEKAVLERRIDELCADMEQMRKTATMLASARTNLLAENAKLRELAAGIGHLLFALDVDYCAACPRDDINHPCPVHTVKGGECLYETDLRDLGVEVDG